MAGPHRTEKGRGSCLVVVAGEVMTGGQSQSPRTGPSLLHRTCPLKTLVLHLFLSLFCPLLSSSPISIFLLLWSCPLPGPQILRGLKGIKP